MQLNPAMRLLSLLPRASVAAMTPRIRNRRSAWGVRGSLPRRVSLTIATIGFLLPFLTWCVLSTSGRVDPVFLPDPLQVLKRCVDWLLNDDLMRDVGVSIGRVFGGFVASAILALPMRKRRSISASAWW